MNLTKWMMAILFFAILLPLHAMGQPDISKEQATALVYNCLNAGQCRIARMLNVDEDKTYYYEISVRVDGVIFSYIVPLNERRLEVFVSTAEYELTLIDADVDGVVDHIIQTSQKNNTALVFGKQHQALHTRAQELYILGLHVALRVFVLHQTTNGK